MFELALFVLVFAINSSNGGDGGDSATVAVPWVTSTFYSVFVFPCFQCCSSSSNNSSKVFTASSALKLLQQHSSFNVFPSRLLCLFGCNGGGHGRGSAHPEGCTRVAETGGNKGIAVPAFKASVDEVQASKL